MQTAAPSPVSTPSAPPLHVLEHTYDLSEQDGHQRSNVFSELRAWREQHNIYGEGWPQILTIFHSDDEKDDEGSFSIFSGEEVGGKRDGSSHWANTGSPDLPFQSPSSDVFQIKAKSLEVACISLSSESTLTPSPPQNATSDPGGLRVSELRARRLRLSGGVAEARAGTAVKPTDDHTELGPIRGDPGLRNQGLQESEAQSLFASPGYSPPATQASLQTPSPRAQVTDRRSFCAVQQRASSNHLVQTTRGDGHHV
ncbi:uncharacterized protein LOC115152112 isoform X2 [Salmo trutta]|nr:uncharacterized protein LOC115152112 isoform X2 [Salmo trutta]